MASGFDSLLLITQVFCPTDSDTIGFLVDIPTTVTPDDSEWRSRRQMAEDWRRRVSGAGLRVLPTIFVPSSDANNRDLPTFCVQDGESLDLVVALQRCTVIIAMTKFSATAPLLRFLHDRPLIRGASMPGVIPAMQDTALSADLAVIRKRTDKLRTILNEGDFADVEFDTGDKVTFDLRFRSNALADDGNLSSGNEHFRFTNLPCGEAFIVPYEGEIPGEPSLTQGIIPMNHGAAVVRLFVEGGKIVSFHTEEPCGLDLIRYFEEDPARCHVAEFGLGCNPRAVVRGIVLEDEKAGFHWAFGRNDHFLDGHNGPTNFLKPSNVVHRDVVYAEGSPIGVDSILIRSKDASIPVIRNNQYVCF